MTNLDAALQQLLVQALQFIPSLIVALVTFAVALLLARPAERAVRRALGLRITEKALLDLLAKLVRWAVIVVGLIAALEQVNFNLTGFLAGLGVAGLTIGFALQDITRNFVAGILLMVRQPFVIGDVVSAAGFVGTVTSVTARDTVIRTLDGEVVIVPNIRVFENPISNYTRSTERMRTIQVGLGYGQDAEHAMTVFLEAIYTVPGVLSEPAPTVWADALGDAAIALSVRFWVDTSASGLLQVHSDAVLALDAAARDAGIDLPYPIQTVRLEHHEPAAL